ncbi:DUF6343 family protein [Actinomadura sp. 6N118]|uniref:DUF6343 family protein n=1 Tax=Actinomadura sp. 6N118 TaxID=3375151 RepID=UPI0037991C51
MRATDHHRQPPGDEPATARSPLRLRAVLSVIALVWAGAAAVLFVFLGRRGEGESALFWGLAVVCVVIIVVAAIDLVVIARRARM